MIAKRTKMNFSIDQHDSAAGSAIIAKSGIQVLHEFHAIALNAR